MTNSTYTPPEIWQWEDEGGGKFGGINRPTSGPREEKALARGEHPFQLYSMATPNGVKVTILLEELLEAGIAEAEYDAYTISILQGEQFSSGFCEINPNSKIPALIDQSGEQPIYLFESGAIMLHLAEKFERFIPSGADRAKCLSWLFWQMGSAPFLGGGFGHFYAYAPEKLEYPINRYAMETKRQLDVLDKHLANNLFICGDEYTIADMAIWPWYGVLCLGELYDAARFLDVESYTHLQRWTKQLAERRAVKRGRVVNRFWGADNEQLLERHSAEDIDKLGL